MPSQTGQRANPIDADTGLLTRLEFLQRAGAEFRRAKRYGRDLAVCVITPLRPNLPGRAFADLAMLVEESCRYGIDICGRTHERQLSVLLPETELIGAMDFLRPYATGVGSQHPYHVAGFSAPARRSAYRTIRRSRNCSRAAIER